MLVVFVVAFVVTFVVCRILGSLAVIALRVVPWWGWLVVALLLAAAVDR